MLGHANIYAELLISIGSWGLDLWLGGMGMGMGMGMFVFVGWDEMR